MTTTTRSKVPATPMSRPPLDLVVPFGGHSEQSWRDARAVREEMKRKGFPLPKLRKR